MAPGACFNNLEASVTEDPGCGVPLRVTVVDIENRAHGIGSHQNKSAILRRRFRAYLHYALLKADVLSGISLFGRIQSGKSLLPERRRVLRQYHFVTNLRGIQEPLMQDSIRTQTKQLCESIACEQDPGRFMELVTRLNELLQYDEANNPSPFSAPPAPAI
jgi:hypothetical protein